jgi:hypothetical protein
LVSFDYADTGRLGGLEGEEVEVKRALLLLVVGVALAAPIHDDFRDKLVTYHQAYDSWLRKYMGCPARKGNPEVDMYETVTCDNSMGGMDMKLWRTSREAAKVLYDLEDKK